MSFVCLLFAFCLLSVCFLMPEQVWLGAAGPDTAFPFPFHPWSHSPADSGCCPIFTCSAEVHLSKVSPTVVTAFGLVQTVAVPFPLLLLREPLLLQQGSNETLLGDLHNSPHEMG